MTQNLKKLFITLEGGEGSGKSTQAKLLSRYLKEEGYEVVLTREPGGSEGAEVIRALILEREWSPQTELFLFLAARQDHIENVIHPALLKGKIVICDRFYHSTLVYQGFGHQNNLPQLQALCEVVHKGCKPDRTYLLHLTPEEGLKRAIERNHSFNRFERLGLEFHQRIYEGFETLAHQDPTIKILDGSKNPEAIFQDIKADIEELLEK